uniref:Nose resistant-to-fluoxetine protein N-terminal domain-containing protein n=1 Tax=Panagrolaimus davidi TaxID=227884 RepID=A0A914P6N0_9BILA
MDATAKIPSGMLRGAQNIFGFMQECDVINYKVPNRKRVFTTAYSRAYISLSGDCENSKITLGFDICMPSSCTSTDLVAVITAIPEIYPTLGNFSNSLCAISTFSDINESMTTEAWIVV